jgi:hypothetical protein
MPAVAGVIGGVLGLIYWGGESIASPWLAAVVAIAVGLVITCEAWGSGLTSAGVVSASLLKIAALATFSGVDGLLALVMAHIVARACVIASWLSTGSSKPAPVDRRAAWAVVVLAGAALAEGGPAGAVALAAAALVTVVAVVLARRSGARPSFMFTATGHATELVILLMLAWLVPDHGWSWR